MNAVQQDKNDIYFALEYCYYRNKKLNTVSIMNCVLKINLDINPWDLV